MGYPAQDNMMLMKVSLKIKQHLTEWVIQQEVILLIERLHSHQVQELMTLLKKWVQAYEFKFNCFVVYN